MSIHVCINYVVFLSVLFYVANREFVFDIVERVNPTLVTYVYVVMWICYCWLIGQMRYHYRV
jgi:hypothetical protein